MRNKPAIYVTNCCQEILAKVTAWRQDWIKATEQTKMELATIAEKAYLIAFCTSFIYNSKESSSTLNSDTTELLRNQTRNIAHLSYSFFVPQYSFFYVMVCLSDIKTPAKNIIKLLTLMAFDPNNAKAQIYDAASDERNPTARFTVALQTDCDNAVSEFLTDRSWLQNAPNRTMSNAAFFARRQTCAHDDLQ